MHATQNVNKPNTFKIAMPIKLSLTLKKHAMCYVSLEPKFAQDSHLFVVVERGMLLITFI